MKYSILTLVVVFSLINIQSIFANEASPYKYVYNPPISELDQRYVYPLTILKAALDVTRLKYGEYELVQAPNVMNENRQIAEISRDSGVINVIHFPPTHEIKELLHPILIPVDKGLSGFMVNLIRKDDQPLFSAVDGIEELQKLTIGQGRGWVDIDILSKSGFEIVVGNSYEGLFRMLISGRFDAFQRSAAEIINEYELRKNDLPELHIEQNLLLYYPLPMYFWFRNSSEGLKLATRVREGMLMMIESGEYDDIFFRFFQNHIDRLNLKNRKIFRIENPILGSETQFDDKRLWYDPL